MIKIEKLEKGDGNKTHRYIFQLLEMIFRKDGNILNVCLAFPKGESHGNVKIA